MCKAVENGIYSLVTVCFSKTFAEGTESDMKLFLSKQDDQPIKMDMLCYLIWRCSFHFACLRFIISLYDSHHIKTNLFFFISSDFHFSHVRLNSPLIEMTNALLWIYFPTCKRSSFFCPMRSISLIIEKKLLPCKGDDQ